MYRALGSKVSVVEFADQLVPAADTDLVKVYTKYNKDNFNIMLSTKVVAVEAKADGLYVTFLKVKTRQQRQCVLTKF